MTPELFFLLGILHAIVAILTTSVNIFVNHRRTSATLRKDSGALRVALAAELASLRDLYKDNVDAIYAERDVLVSGRMVGAIYRGNLGRIHTLPAQDIPALIAAYAMCERAEAHAMAHCKAHGAIAFSMGKERPYAESLVALYEKAAAAVERALRTLAPADACDEPTAAEEAERRLAAS